MKKIKIIVAILIIGIAGGVIFYACQKDEQGISETSISKTYKSNMPFSMKMIYEVSGVECVDILESNLKTNIFNFTSFVGDSLLYENLPMSYDLSNTTVINIIDKGKNYLTFEGNGDTITLHNIKTDKTSASFSRTFSDGSVIDAVIESTVMNMTDVFNEIFLLSDIYEPGNYIDPPDNQCWGCSTLAILYATIQCPSSMQSSMNETRRKCAELGCLPIWVDGCTVKCGVASNPCKNW